MNIDKINIDNYIKENHPEPKVNLSSNELLLSKQNYLSDPTGKNNDQMFNTKLIYNSTKNDQRLYEQLLGKNRHKSYFYNCLVFICFNVNITHFCFPYLTDKCGILLSLLILIICGIFSFTIQNSLVSHITHRGSNNYIYAHLIENNFGSFCASLLEALVMIWYGILLLICLRTGKYHY
jgi:hypothetical protein